MIDVWDIVFLVGAGLAGGMVAGMLGIGGGIIYVLIFSQFIDHFTAAEIANNDIVQLLVANSAFALVFAGVSGSVKHYQTQNFHPRPVGWIGIPGIAAAIVTTIVINHFQLYSKKEFAVLFSIIMIPVILRVMFQENFKNRGFIRPRLSILISTGVFSGLGTALTGLGGGFITVPVLNGLIRMPIKKTISVSLGVIGLVAAGFTTFNLLLSKFNHYHFTGSVGAVIFPMALPVIAGVLVATPIGVLAAQRLPHRTIRIVFVLFSLFTIVKIWYDFLLDT